MNIPPDSDSELGKMECVNCNTDSVFLPHTLPANFRVLVRVSLPVHVQGIASCVDSAVVGEAGNV